MVLNDSACRLISVACEGRWVVITLYNVCAVPCGVLSTVGVFSTVGGYHEYRGGIS